jgi:hypothetical protein
MWLIYFGLGIAAVIYIGLTDSHSKFPMPVLIPSVFTLPFGLVMGRIFFNYAKKKRQYLKISRGNNLFFFGASPNEINTYKKSNVVEVKHYTDNSMRSPNSFHRYEICFNNSNSITFTNALISPGDFAMKWRSPITEVRQAPIKLSWSAP